MDRATALAAHAVQGFLVANLPAAAAAVRSLRIGVEAIGVHVTHRDAEHLADVFGLVGPVLDVKDGNVHGEWTGHLVGHTVRVVAFWHESETPKPTAEEA